jgi:hypothetical protein
MGEGARRVRALLMKCLVFEIIEAGALIRPLLVAFGCKRITFSSRLQTEKAKWTDRCTHDL